MSKGRRPKSGHIKLLSGNPGKRAIQGITDPLTEMPERPEWMSDKAKAVWDIILADFSQYAIGLRKEMRLESSIHARFSTDQTSWRMIVRIDGQPLWDEVLTLEDGTNTVSPFVTLAART